MPEQFAHGVQINAASKTQRGEGMPRTVEGNLFIETGQLYPMTNSLVDTLLCAQLEDRAWRYFANDPRRHLGAGLVPKDRHCLFRDGQSFNVARLHLGEFQDEASVCLLHLLPHQSADVGVSEASEGRKQKGLLCIFVAARRGGQELQFFQSQVFAAGLSLFNGNVCCRIPWQRMPSFTA